MPLRVKEVVFHLQHSGVALFQTKKGVWTVLGIKVPTHVVQKMLDADMLEKNTFGHYMLKGADPFWFRPFLAPKTLNLLGLEPRETKQKAPKP